MRKHWERLRNRQCRFVSMKAENHRRSDKVTFYKIGLGGRNGQLEPGLGAKTWKTESFSDIKSKLGHQNVSTSVTVVRILTGLFKLAKHSWLNSGCTRDSAFYTRPSWDRSDLRSTYLRSRAESGSASSAPYVRHLLSRTHGTDSQYLSLIHI